MSAYKDGQKFDFKVGDKVICNGYEGAIISWYSEGMVEVRLSRGSVCVSACYPDCYPLDFNISLENLANSGHYLLDRDGDQYIRVSLSSKKSHWYKVIHVTNSRHEVIKFTDKNDPWSLIDEDDKGNYYLCESVSSKFS